jgi:hypothetical protein
MQFDASATSSGLDGYWSEKQIRIDDVAESDANVASCDGTLIHPQKTFSELPSADLL